MVEKLLISNIKFVEPLIQCIFHSKYMLFILTAWLAFSWTCFTRRNRLVTDSNQDLQERFTDIFLTSIAFLPSYGWNIPILAWLEYCLCSMAWILPLRCITPYHSCCTCSLCHKLFTHIYGQNQKNNLFWNLLVLISLIWGHHQLCLYMYVWKTELTYKVYMIRSLQLRNWRHMQLRRYSLCPLTEQIVTPIDSCMTDHKD